MNLMSSLTLLGLCCQRPVRGQMSQRIYIMCRVFCQGTACRSKWGQSTECRLGSGAVFIMPVTRKQPKYFCLKHVAHYVVIQQIHVFSKYNKKYHTDKLFSTDVQRQLIISPSTIQSFFIMYNRGL